MTMQDSLWLKMSQMEDPRHLERCKKALKLEIPAPGVGK